VTGPDPGWEADQGQELAVSAPAASALALVALSWPTYYLRQPAVIRDGFWLAPASDATATDPIGGAAL
jgi:hypothetical protein